jgi:hypothetical protein
MAWATQTNRLWELENISCSVGCCLSDGVRRGWKERSAERYGAVIPVRAEKPEGEFDLPKAAALFLIELCILRSTLARR